MLRPLACLMLASTLAMPAVETHAALGRPPSTLAGNVSHPVPAAVARRLAASAPAPSNQYTVQETQLESRTVVREYATPAGQVFAVTWQGPVLPDLKTLLGGYFPAFAQETAQAQQSGRQRSRVLMLTPGLVVQSTGRMGRFLGHAYAPDLVPAGVDVQALLP
jgi:hypothetical protein